MSYCKAFAPCFRVTEGDRRVTGMTMVFNKPPNPLKGGTTDSAGTPPPLGGKRAWGCFAPPDIER